MKLAANLTWLFTELPLIDRINAAAVAGFDGVEILDPYSLDPHILRDALEQAGLPLVLINMPSNGIADMGCAAVPGEEARFRREFEQATAYARKAGAGIVHVLSGKTDDPDAANMLRDNLRWASGQTPDLKLTIEPLNPTDVPGYFLNDFHQAAELVRSVNLPNVRLQFDAYHAMAIHGEALELWQSVGHLVGHVQIAGAPLRNEPDRGETDYRAFFRLLGRSGYDGFVSAEYRPDTTTEAGLGWMDLARTEWSAGNEESDV